MASVRGHRGDTDVQEVVRVTQVLTQPLQRGLQQRLDALDHHLEMFLLTWAEEESVVTRAAARHTSTLCCYAFKGSDELNFAVGLFLSWQQQRGGWHLSTTKIRNRK